MVRAAASHRYGVVLCAVIVSVSAYFGAIGLAFGMLPGDATVAAKLPFHSLVFGAVALVVIVAIPTTWLTWLAWRRHPRATDMATLTGLILVGWIVVEVLVIGEFSVLQVVYAIAGITLVALGSRAMLGEVAAAVAAIPLLTSAPLYRRYHTRWGATDAEVAAHMAGDDLLERAHLVATRAITVQAPAEHVWPWLAQVGIGRAGFYSIDLLDNLGRTSATEIHPEWQHSAVGDVAAPMSPRPTATTSFLVAVSDPPTRLVWSKPNSTWSWQLTTQSDGSTRLITRLKVRHQATPSGLLGIVLLEFGDFAMMRAMLRGLKHRAETAPIPASRQDRVCPPKGV
jgi:hypothetical protein